MYAKHNYEDREFCITYGAFSVYQAYQGLHLFADTEFNWISTRFGTEGTPCLVAKPCVHPHNCVPRIPLEKKLMQTNDLENTSHELLTAKFGGGRTHSACSPPNQLIRSGDVISVEVQNLLKLDIVTCLPFYARRILAKIAPQLAPLHETHFHQSVACFNFGETMWKCREIVSQSFIHKCCFSWLNFIRFVVALNHILTFGFFGDICVSHIKSFIYDLAHSQATYIDNDSAQVSLSLDLRCCIWKDWSTFQSPNLWGCNTVVTHRRVLKFQMWCLVPSVNTGLEVVTLTKTRRHFLIAWNHLRKNEWRFPFRFVNRIHQKLQSYWKFPVSHLLSVVCLAV